MQGRDSDSSSQEGQKNERQEPEPKLKKELTEEEKLKRNKMMVLGAAVIGMVVIVLWLFSSLGGGSDDAVVRSGFNTEMPDADKGSTGIADKSKAYEMDGVKKNQQARHDLGAYSVSETDSVAVTDDMNGGGMQRTEPDARQFLPAVGRRCQRGTEEPHSGTGAETDVTDSIKREQR